MSEALPTAESDAGPCTCSPARIDGHLIHQQVCPRSVTKRSKPTEACANYNAPMTCLTAPSTETGRCDYCRAHDERSLGIINKYEVKRRNDPTGKHDDCGYFVLDPRHDPFAAAALRAYAREAGGPLGADITRWLHDLDYCPICTQVRGHRGSCVTSPGSGDPS